MIVCAVGSSCEWRVSCLHGCIVHGGGCEVDMVTNKRWLARSRLAEFGLDLVELAEKLGAGFVPVVIEGIDVFVDAVLLVV